MAVLELDRESKLFRSNVARGISAPDEQPAIERKGGNYKAGLIRGISVITLGEARGHDLWIDAEMLQQVATGINAKSEGFKSRFAHPSVSGDGIGKMTGRVMNARVEGDRVLADWHALESAHKTPDGDLAGYVMDLAEEAPADFGTSIAFARDLGAEKAFKANNAGTDGRFISPDETNRNNLPHARVAAMKAVDIVDEPAANPGGLFHRNPFDLLETGDELLSFVFGLTDEAPDTSNLGIEAARLKGFVQRFAQSRGVIFKEALPMPEEQKPQETTVDVAALKAEGATAERLRAADITAMCAQARRPELAQGYIEEGLSVAEVQTQLFKALCADMPAVGDTPKEESQTDENSAYRAEYKADSSYSKSMTEDEYVAMRRIDDGLDTLTAGSAVTK